MKKLILYFTLVVFLNSCTKEKQECPDASEKSFAFTSFTKINAGDAHTVTISKGNDFSIKARGCTSDLEDLAISIDANHILDIKYKNYKPNRYRVDFTITLPILVSANLSGAAKATISGFEGQNIVLRTVLSGASECTVNGTTINAAIDISGASKLVLIGQTGSLYGNISGASQLEAYGVSATEVDISASGNSKAFVFPQQIFFGEATGNSRIYYKGNPSTTHFEISGNGKIIKN